MAHDQDPPPSDPHAGTAAPANGTDDPPAPPGPIARAFAAYDRVPLYLRILVGLILGIVAGTVMYTAGGDKVPAVARVAGGMDMVAKYVIQFLAALAPPLILLAVVRALLTAKIEGRQGAYMVFLLVLNTVVAIVVGLLVANVVRPGKFAHGTQPPPAKGVGEVDIVKQLLENIPASLLEPLVSGRVIGVVIIALVFGMAARQLVGRHRQLIEDLVEAGFTAIITVLHWVIWLVPLAVLCKVGSILGTKGYQPFVALGVFILAVLLALALQAGWYLGRIKWKSWVGPADLLRHTRDALVMAFSTGSSTATMPVTYDRLRNGVGLRERSASLGALVGSNFNNDGTALYEAMAALFVAQMLGIDLSLGQQVLVVLTSVIASVGAAGIPEAGLVTMTLVFTAVDLPTTFIPFLLPVDWFLDRCRTAINVMGDMNVSCLLDGKDREEPPPPGGAAPGPAAAPGGFQVEPAGPAA
jgi:Na+/H+-dicarboxylate symporter